MPTLNLFQAQTLLEMFDGEDSLITVEESDTGHSGPGVYAHFEEYPDEGAVFLATEPDPAFHDEHPDCPPTSSLLPSQILGLD